MTVRMNDDAVAHANGLIRRGELMRDERDAWSDTEKTDGTKGRYLFPYGDFKKVHRCALISGESRAGQYEHATVEKAIKGMLESVDKKS